MPASVSFIVPLYNCLSLTKAMLASLQATVPAGLKYEIVLVDDGSTDGTREWLGSLRAPEIKVLLNEKNLGYAGANNRAAAAATGELLVLLNNDLVLLPSWLEPMLALQQELPKPGAIGNIQLNASTGTVDHAGIYVTEKGKPEHDVRPASRRGRKRFHPAPAVTGACLLVETRCWRELGGFSEEFCNGGEDVDLCFRLGRAGCVNAVALDSVIRHHVSASPGRKDNDERNSYVLTLRWEQKLVELGARDWCRKHLRRTPYREMLSLPAILAYLAGWKKTPPAAAKRGVQAAIAHSLGLWSARFGDLRRVGSGS